MDFTRFGGELLSHALRRSTIAAAVLNFRVRDGTGCFTCAMTTKPRKIQIPKAFGFSWLAAVRVFAEQMPVAAPELCHEDIFQMRSEINQRVVLVFVMGCVCFVLVPVFLLLDQIKPIGPLVPVN